MQILWATAGADWSREQRAIELSLLSPEQQRAVAGTQEPTLEEQLLAELLAANGELLEALRMYDDLRRVGIEREAEERSDAATRIGRSVRLRAARVCVRRSHCGCSRCRILIPAVVMAARVTISRISTFPVQGLMQAAGHVRMAARARSRRRRQVAGVRRHPQAQTRI
jgi:hypothetical protein